MSASQVFQVMFEFGRGLVTKFADERYAGLSRSVHFVLMDQPLLESSKHFVTETTNEDFRELVRGFLVVSVQLQLHFISEFHFHCGLNGMWDRFLFRGGESGALVLGNRSLSVNIAQMFGQASESSDFLETMFTDVDLVGILGVVNRVFLYQV